MDKPKRYEYCPAYQCIERITCVLVYGCINGHVNEMFGCTSHTHYFQNILAKYHCGKCNQLWEDSLIEELWTATTR